MRTRLVMLAMRRDLVTRVGTGGGCSLGVGRARDPEVGGDMMFDKLGTQRGAVSMLNVITTYDTHRVLPN